MINMGKFDFDIPADLTKMLNKMDGYDEIAPQILNQVSPIVENEIKRGYEKHKRTGNTAKSVKRRKASKNAIGWMAAVYPSGMIDTYMDANEKIRKRKQPIRAGELAAYWEYGTRTMAARPVITPAIANTQEEVLERMQQEYEKIIKGGR